jgi:hypothetical protein
VKSWCIPKPGARFVAKMEDVLAVYQRPYNPQQPVICLDEIEKALRSTPRGTIALQPGQPRREDYEYTRAGKCSVFLAVEPLAGFRKVWVSHQRTKLDFAEVVKTLVDDLYPDAEKLILVTDNLNIHHPAALYERFAPAEARRLADKLEWHYTPEHGSWLNIAECELSVLRRQSLRMRDANIETVRRKLTAWETDRNQRQTGIDWQFTNDRARIKLKRLYPVVNVRKLS